LILTGVVLLALSTCGTELDAQELATKNKRAAVDSSLQLMRTDTWQKRSEGFYGLLRAQLGVDLNGASTKIAPALQALMREVPDRGFELTTTLIDVLRRENAFSSSAQTTAEFSSYHGDLVLAVASLGDRRALSPLVDILETGNLATRGVARLGASAALVPVLNLVKAASDSKRNAAIRTLAYLLDPNINPEPVTQGQRAEIKEALVRATSDVTPFVRISAIEGVSRLSDPDVVGLLRRLSETDPYSTIEESGQVVFPVREAAKRALASSAAGKAGAQRTIPRDRYLRVPKWITRPDDTANWWPPFRSPN